jgi:K+-sensing histidine kinase KdpD
MHKTRTLSRGLKPFLGVLICCSIAGVSCVLFRAQDSKTMLLLLFLAVITAVSIRCGRLAGVLGTCAAAAIFALALFPPVGSLNIHDMSQRSSVGWFWVGGITVSFLIGTSPEAANDNRRPPTSLA